MGQDHSRTRRLWCAGALIVCFGALPAQAAPAVGDEDAAMTAQLDTYLADIFPMPSRWQRTAGRIAAAATRARCRRKT